MNQSYHFSKTLQKAFEILDYISKNKNVTAKGIEHGLSISYNTVMDTLKTMEGMGVVRQDTDGWRIGMKLAIYWARAKSDEQADRDHADKNLNLLGG